MHRECREHFPCHRGLAIPTASPHVHHACAVTQCRDRYLVVSFEAGGRESVPGIPGANATCNYMYLVHGFMIQICFAEVGAKQTFSIFKVVLGPASI